MSHAVKCREVGKKKWAFISRGGINNLRIHALQFAGAEKAQAFIDVNKDDNPEWEFKVVEFGEGRK
jgi:hypothetical protein